MKICFTGDLFIGGDFNNYDGKGCIQSKLYNESDIRVVNLEQAISDSAFTENKSTLHTGTNCTYKLKNLNIDYVCLANNHIHDKGEIGINDSISSIRSFSIKEFGAGKTIEEATRPCKTEDNIVFLGYCDFNKTYLKDVLVATEDSAGVAPLRLDVILQNLDELDESQRAILYFHWGVEHAWLPPVEDINLMKKCLEHEKVITVLGMHAHRIQGVIRHKGKVGYMCLGNFLFPNFHIAPPVQIINLQEKHNVLYKTRFYHRVYHITYKLWKKVNRVSLNIQLDTENMNIVHEFVEQKDLEPKVDSLSGFSLKLFTVWFNLLSVLYRLPEPLYKLLYSALLLFMKIKWKSYISFKYFQQLGFLGFNKKIATYILKKLRLSDG